MKIFKTVDGIIKYRDTLENSCIGYIATSGYIHDGHKMLIKASVRAKKTTVVSILVRDNDNSREELDARNQSLVHDFDVLNELGVKAVFVLTQSELHSSFDSIVVDSAMLSSFYSIKGLPKLISSFLTTHNKLFHIIRPHDVYVGKNNYPLYFLTMEMINSFFLPIHVHGIATVRSPVGLPLSTYNSYLSEEERERASIVYKGLNAAKGLIEKKKTISKKELLQVFKSIVAAEKKINLEYIEIASRSTLVPVEQIEKGKGVILTAFSFEKTKKNFFSKSSAINLSDSIEL